MSSFVPDRPVAEANIPGQYSSFTHIVIASTGSVKNVVVVLLEWTWEEMLQNRVTTAVVLHTS